MSPVVLVDHQRNADGAIGVSVQIAATPHHSRTTLPNYGRVPFVRRPIPVDVLEQALAALDQTAVVVLFGRPGVGKTRLACEYAKSQFDLYTGGVWLIRFDSLPPLDFIEVMRLLGAPEYEGEDLDAQCRRALRTLGSEPTLLIYDGVASEEDLSTWLPAQGTKCHVIATSTSASWSMRHATSHVPPLSKQEATSLANALLVSSELVNRFSAQIVQRACGLPVQLCADARALSRAVARDRPVAWEPLAEETNASFRSAWELLSSDARLLLRVAALFDGARIPRAEVGVLLQAEDWSRPRVVKALDEAQDRCLMVSTTEDLVLHDLVRAFVLAQNGPELSDGLLDRYRRAAEHASKDAAARPNNARAASRVLSYSGAESWSRFARLLGSRAARFAHTSGVAFANANELNAAIDWFVRAIAAASCGSPSDATLASSLNEHASCLLKKGQYSDARQSYLRSVEAWERCLTDDADYRQLAVCMHQVGYCLLKEGSLEEARIWFERAIASHKKNEGAHRVDVVELGRSIQLLGECLSSMKRRSEAARSFEHAAKAYDSAIPGFADKHKAAEVCIRMAVCYFELKNYRRAKDAYHEAASLCLAGTPHKRVCYHCLGVSYHGVAECLWRAGRKVEARMWYHRAVQAKGNGNEHGRVDPDSVGASLHMVALCFLDEGNVELARAHLDEAIRNKKQGDQYGYVDQASLRSSIEVRNRVGASRRRIHRKRR